MSTTWLVQHENGTEDEDETENENEDKKECMANLHDASPAKQCPTKRDCA